jgi:hypothetical protein
MHELATNDAFGDGPSTLEFVSEDDLAAFEGGSSIKVRTPRSSRQTSWRCGDVTLRRGSRPPPLRRA